MVHYEHFPIYNKAMEVTVYFEKIIKKFSGYNKYTPSILFFQVGRFYEFYNNQGCIVMKCLGLRMIKGIRGFKEQCGLPVKFEKRYQKQLLREGSSVYVIREERLLAGLKKIRVIKGYLPISAIA